MTTHYAGKVNAPDFPAGLDWFNATQPISLTMLRGKIVLLDFWTFCCINCVHILPQLRKLERKYAAELFVIGVHSPKFPTEKEPANLQHAVERLAVGHPVVNDRDFRVWQTYSVRCWPTLMFIDPKGKVVALHEGEFDYDLLDAALARMIAEYDAQGWLDRTPLSLTADSLPNHQSALLYPGKVLATADAVFVADTGHHRIVEMEADAQTIRRTFGSGIPGFADGAADVAQFHGPQGMARDGDFLYVADADNHAIRRIDLRTGDVVTLSGTGEQAKTGNTTGPALNSPWDIAIVDGILYIAMAGAHQIWQLDLTTHHASIFAGNGRENIIDGGLNIAEFAQPSGIVYDANRQRLYVADSEVSAIREIDWRRGGNVSSLAGQGLFDFGDRDGDSLPIVRLQHPLGLTCYDGRILIADTYNHKIKCLDPLTRTVTTWPQASEGLSEPSGLSVQAGKLYIADTNHHRIVVVPLPESSQPT